MSMLSLCLSLFAFVFIITQIEFIWTMHLLKECDKTEKTLGEWTINLHKKVDDVIFNSEKETEQFNEALNEVLNLQTTNPYQE